MQTKQPPKFMLDFGKSSLPSCLVTRTVQLCKRLFDAWELGKCWSSVLGWMTLVLWETEKSYFDSGFVNLWLKAVRHWSLYPNITCTSAIDINNAYMTLCRKQVWNVLGPFSFFPACQKAKDNIEHHASVTGKGFGGFYFWVDVLIHLLNKIYFSLGIILLELCIQKTWPSKAILSINSIMIMYKRVCFKSFKKKNRSAYYL